MPSIYGPTVTRENAAEWLHNNPRAAQSPSLLQVADFNANGGVDAMELSKACQAGTVMLDGVHHFRLIDDAPAPALIRKQGAVSGKTADSGAGTVGKMMVAFFGGLTLVAVGGKIKSTPVTLAGIGVLFGGVTWAACSGKH